MLPTCNSPVITRGNWFAKNNLFVRHSDKIKFGVKSSFANQLNSGQSVETLSSLTIDCFSLSPVQSGSHGNLCDSWQEEQAGPASPATPTQQSAADRRKLSAIRALPAEYPFQV